MSDAREELVEKMARANHAVWRAEWLKFGKLQPEELPEWDLLHADAKAASLRCQAAALAAIEEQNVVVPRIPDTTQRWAGWRTPGKSFSTDQDPMNATGAVYTAMWQSAPLYTKEK